MCLFAHKLESYLLLCTLPSGARITFHLLSCPISGRQLGTASCIMSAFFNKSAVLAALFLFLIHPVISYKRDITTWTITKCGVSPAGLISVHRRIDVDTGPQTFCYESICNSTEHGECACDAHLHDLEICMFDECLVATDYHNKFTPDLLESSALLGLY